MKGGYYGILLFVFFFLCIVVNAKINENQTSICGAPTPYLFTGDLFSTPHREYRLRPEVTAPSAVIKHCLKTLVDEYAWDLPRQLGIYLLGSAVAPNVRYDCEVLPFMERGSLGSYPMNKITVLPAFKGLYLSGLYMSAKIDSACPRVGLHLRFHSEPTEASLQRDLAFLTDTPVSFHVQLHDHELFRHAALDV